MLRRSGRGFTLVELMVAVTILSILMTGIYGAIIFGSSSWHKTESHVDIKQNVCIAANRVSRELRTARNVNISSSIYDIDFKLPGGKHIGYYLNNGQLLRDVDGSAHNVVAYGIKDVTFRMFDDEGLVYIEILGVTDYKIITAVHMRAQDMQIPLDI